MNCPYCAKEMESGYLRGGSGYELLCTMLKITLAHTYPIPSP